MLTQGLNLQQMQNTWASQLNPLLATPIIDGNLLEGIDISSGSNVVNHKLGRKLRGWIIVRIDGVAVIYDTQATNQTPELTLTLTSDAAVTVSLWVF